MKHCLIINHYAQDDNGISGARHFFLARNIEKYDWKVTIIHATFSHTHNKELSSGRFKYKNIDFIRIKTPRYSGNSVGRLFNSLIFSLRIHFSKEIKRIEKIDCVIGSTVHPFAALSAYYLSKKYKKPFIFEIRDLWPQTLIDYKKINPNGYIAKTLYLIEKFLSEKSSKIVTLLPNMHTYLSKYNLNKLKISYVPNGFDHMSISIPKDIKKNDDFTCMYFGALGEPNGLDTLIDAAIILDKNTTLSNKIKFKIIGTGSEKDRIQRKIFRNNIKNISMHEPLPKNELYKEALKCDLFCMMLPNKPDLYKYGISSNKIFEYMYLGKPILFSGKNVTFNNPIEDANCGLSVKSEDSVAFANAIESFFKMPLSERDKMGNNGRTYVCKYHEYDVLSYKLKSILDNVINGS